MLSQGIKKQRKHNDTALCQRQAGMCIDLSTKSKRAEAGGIHQDIHKTVGNVSLVLNTLYVSNSKEI